MIQRVEKCMAIDFTKWCGRLLLECDDDWYECYWLKLPSYGWHKADYGRRDAWCQLMLFWHGRDGLTYWWEPVRTGAKP